MDKSQTGVLCFLLFVHTTVGHVEPRCSKYDFEEKVLEKVIRFEHKMELIMESVNEISAKVNGDLSKMKKEIEKQRTEQTYAFHQLAENITTEWMEIKKDFETMKRDLDGQESVLNETIHNELNRFNKSFDDLAGNFEFSTDRSKIIQSCFPASRMAEQENKLNRTIS